MNRTSLDSNVLGLFIFPYEQYVSFWMKDTIVPLDLFFLDEKGKVVDVFLNLKPLSERKYESTEKVMYAIEVKSGTVARLDIQKDDYFYQIIDFKREFSDN